MEREDGKLSKRQVEREISILTQSLLNSPGMSKRSIPLSLFRKLLDAALWAIENGYHDAR